ncbi:hypothetical protein BDR26DRAFT_890946 [Obelidium mucronatum]|nr:hypothetical protein BDR26DRAFT_890946 [Obelidium mucronatum]
MGFARKPSKPNPTTKSGFFANQIKQDEERKQKAMVLEAGKQAEREKIKEKVRAEALKDAFVNQEVDAKLMGMFDEDDEVNPRKRGADSDDEEGGSDQDDHETKRLRLMAKLSADPNASNEEEEEDSMDGTQQPSEPTNELMVDDAVINGVTEPGNSKPAWTTILSFDKSFKLLVDIERITRRVRRRRKVIKKVTSQVGKYMKTVDVEGWESYSEEELAPVVKSVPKVPVMQQHDVVVDPMPVENKPVEAAASTKKTSPTKPKGKAATKKAAANHGQKLISSFFKK